MAEFLSLKKNQQVCVLQSYCEMNVLSANSAVECSWMYSDDTLNLCLFTVSWGDEKKVDSCFLFFYFLFFLLLVLKFLVLKDYLFIF